MITSTIKGGSALIRLFLPPILTTKAPGPEELPDPQAFEGHSHIIYIQIDLVSAHEYKTLTVARFNFKKVRRTRYNSQELPASCSCHFRLDLRRRRWVYLPSGQMETLKCTFSRIENKTLAL